jgi:hypothetical protein
MALKDRATDMLRGIPISTPYKNTFQALEDRYGDQHFGAAYHCSLKLASDRMKTRYHKLANSAGYQEGESGSIDQPARKGNRQSFSYRGKAIQGRVTWINDGVFRIQRNPRSRIMVVHLDRLALYQGAAQDERT